MSRWPELTGEHDPDGWTEWVWPVMPPKRYKMACCDCGLVHEFEFEVVEDEGTRRVAFRVRRLNRSTGQVRRHKVANGEGVFASFGRIVREVRKIMAESDS